MPNVPRPIGSSPQASPSGDQGRPTLPGKTRFKNCSLYFIINTSLMYQWGVVSYSFCTAVVNILFILVVAFLYKEHKSCNGGLNYYTLGSCT